jgi:hypothetical protein
LARSLTTLLFAVAYFGPCIRQEGMGIYLRPGPERESVIPHFVSAVRDSQPFGNEPSCSSRNLMAHWADYPLNRPPMLPTRDLYARKSLQGG